MMSPLGMNVSFTLNSTTSTTSGPLPPYLVQCFNFVNPRTTARPNPFRVTTYDPKGNMMETTPTNTGLQMQQVP